MSHAATNWAIQQRGLKPTTKIVLWHLCDRFNPDFGCFPSQEQLADDCEISRSTLNEHLALLETAGLIRRVQRLNPSNKRQNTMYARYHAAKAKWVCVCVCSACCIVCVCAQPVALW